MDQDTDERFYQLPKSIREHYSGIGMRSIQKISVPMVKAGQGARFVITLIDGQRDTWDFEKYWRLKNVR